MEWKKISHIEDNKYNFPGSWLYVHYYEALNVLFRIENSLRIFVYITLKSEFKEKWNELSITSDDEDKSTIASIAKKRISQDDNFAYLGYSNNNSLMYLTSGELIRIITSDSYWKYFKSYFPGSREIMKNKLDEIGNIRNSLAHFRPIKEGDVDLIKQNAKHTLSKIEETIVQLIRCPDSVPSNTNENWFNSLISTGNEYISLKFQQSSDEKWVKVILDYQSPVISKQKSYSNSYYYYTLKLKLNNLLNENPNLTKYILFASEEIPYSTFDIDNPNFSKSIKLVFDRKCLNEKHIEIKEEFEKCLRMIFNESELIKQDNLAKGKIIEGITIRVYLEDQSSPKYWIVANRKELLSTSLENDPPEFWGSINHASINYISDTEKFPWMRVEIGEDKELPF